MTCNFKYEIEEFLRHELISETQIMGVILQKICKKRMACNQSANIPKFCGFRRNVSYTHFLLWLVGWLFWA